MSPRALLDRLVGICLKLLAGAVALYVAVRLIESVAAVLLIIAGVAVSAGLVIVLVRHRNRGW